ncbi:MAG: ribonuclease P protein component [Alphaproteobacteria bacterium]|nr:ribonuclease P protein component [Alphaproteobacteria bacterium]
MSDKLILIKKRPDFLHVTHNGYKIVKSGFVLQAALSRRFFPAPAYRIGYTASKKIGNAVLRNRAKRRLRAVCRALLPLEAVCGYDYVIIARHMVLDIPYKKLYKELKIALTEIKQEFDDNVNATGTTDK